MTFPFGLCIPEAGAADGAEYRLALHAPCLALWGTALWHEGAMHDASKTALPALQGTLAYFIISRNEQELPSREIRATRSPTQMVFRNCRMRGLLKCELAKGRDSLYFI